MKEEEYASNDMLRNIFAKELFGKNGYSDFYPEEDGNFGEGYICGILKDDETFGLSIATISADGYAVHFTLKQNHCMEQNFYQFIVLVADLMARNLPEYKMKIYKEDNCVGFYTPSEYPYD